MFSSLVLFVLLMTGCAVPGKKAVTNPTVNVDRIASVAIGTDKAEVLRIYGAPLLIEIEAQKFRYTYVRGPNSKVTIFFDENHKVSSVGKQDK